MFIAKQQRNRSKRNRKRVRVRFSENGKYAHGSVAAASFRTSFSSGPVFLLRNDRTPTNGNRLSGPRRTYFRSFDRRPAGPTSCPERSDSSHSYTNTCIIYSPYFLPAKKRVLSVLQLPSCTKIGSNPFFNTYSLG